MMAPLALLFCVYQAGSHVTEVIEDAIAALARPENPLHGGIPFATRGARVTASVATGAVPSCCRERGRWAPRALTR